MTASSPLPSFLITIDTEGDNLWSRPSPFPVTTRNARFLPRFQHLCERYGLRPTYVCNWEMVQDEFFREFGRDILRRDTGEIGMHLHAWDSPPLEPLTDNDRQYHPYLIEFPDAVIAEKVRVLTAALEDSFGRKMVSHRAGRWAMDDRYARVLLANGYLVDCSVTPGVSWSSNPGAPSGRGGTDYRGFPDRAYFVDPDNIKSEGTTNLLEVPMTVVPTTPTMRARQGFGAVRRRDPRAARAAARRSEVSWLRPGPGNRETVLAVLETCRRDGRAYAEFMLHSSEFMPGGSPNFPTEASIERLYEDLEALFEAARGGFRAQTLAEFRGSMRGSTHDA